MLLQQQVCTLEQAKKLKELGIQQMSVNSWVHKGPYNCGDEYNEAAPAFLTDGCSQQLDFPYIFDACAFSVAELGVLLPHNPSTSENYSWYHRNNWRGHSVGYNALGLPSIEQEWFKTEAEARAGMLISLLENKLIPPEECNNRLNPQA
jgi:hypothetical protein